MRKILFLIMLVVLGNSFAEPSKNSKIGNMSNEITENEKKEIERVLQKELQFVINEIVGASLSEVSKIIGNQIFDKQSDISVSAKDRILQKFSKEYISMGLNNIDTKLDIKQFKNLPNNKVQVFYNLRIKDISKISLENKKEMGEKILRNLGYKSQEEVKKILMNSSNDAKKEKIYETILQESLKVVGEKMKNIKAEIFLVKDATTILVKRNGVWKIEGLNN